MAGTLTHRQMQTYTQRPKSNSCRTKTKERSPTVFSSFSSKNPSFKEQNVNKTLGNLDHGYHGHLTGKCKIKNNIQNKLNLLT